MKRFMVCMMIACRSNKQRHRNKQAPKKQSKFLYPQVTRIVNSCHTVQVIHFLHPLFSGRASATLQALFSQAEGNPLWRLLSNCCDWMAWTCCYRLSCCGHARRPDSRMGTLTSAAQWRFDATDLLLPAFCHFAAAAESDSGFSRPHFDPDLPLCRPPTRSDCPPADWTGRTEREALLVTALCLSIPVPTCPLLRDPVSSSRSPAERERTVSRMQTASSHVTGGGGGKGNQKYRLAFSTWDKTGITLIITEGREGGE